ncbi:MAG: WYL domain-containing protein [Bacteroidota bacterium]
MNETKQKIYQIFQLIRHLNTPPGKTVQQLIKILHTSRSTIYRDLETLEEIGYVVKTDAQNRKSLELQFPRTGKDILEPEELFFLQKQLQSVASTTPNAHLASSILHKFDRNVSMIPLVDMLPQVHRHKVLTLLRLAMQRNWCVLIKGYRSMTSNTVSDRKAEPLEITQDARYCIAWDLDKNRQSQFKINRIEDVEVLDEKAKPHRPYSPMDLFGLTGEEWLSVKMKLSATAHHLLVEEFSLSRQYIRSTPDGIYFDCPQIRNWKGIGRFVLGLPGEIEVIAPEEFKAYLRERITLF